MHSRPQVGSCHAEVVDIVIDDWDGKETPGVVRPNGSGGQRICPDVNKN